MFAHFQCLLCFDLAIQSREVSVFIFHAERNSGLKTVSGSSERRISLKTVHYQPDQKSIQFRVFLLRFF